MKNSVNNLIEINALYYSRPNGLVCADGLDFLLSDDQKVAIVGSNGSGKSTLLQLILGLINSEQGIIKLFGQDCKTENDFANQRSKIGYLFQDADDQLFCPTVLEDVCFGPVNQGLNQHQAEERAMQILQELGIVHLAHQVSYHLSGGEKRLVSLATVLVMKPKVLLLDEPTNGLDVHNYRLFIDKIKRTQLPIILISHDLELCKELTNIEYQLNNGKLIRCN